MELLALWVGVWFLLLFQLWQWWVLSLWKKKQERARKQHEAEIRRLWSRYNTVWPFSTVEQPSDMDFNELIREIRIREMEKELLRKQAARELSQKASERGA